MLKTVHTLHKGNLNILKRLPTLSSYSTKPVVKEKVEYDNQIKEFERISNISQRKRTKRPTKPPFVKNLLLGIFDTDILTYPELDKETWINLEKEVKPVELALQQPEIKAAKSLTKQFMNKLSSSKVLGLQASQLMGGRELGTTETSRFLEVISDLNLKNFVINSEQTGAQILSKFGSDKLKRKYLQPLIQGDALSTFCMVQSSQNNFDPLKRTAVLSSDTKHWILNGKSRLIANGANADFFVVIAHTDFILKDDVKEQKLTAFLVEREFGGMTTTKHETVSPLFEISDITFENTHIPAENVIGEVHCGEKILTTIYPETRLCVAPVCSVLNRNLINKTIKHFIEISDTSNPLFETEGIQEKIGELITSNYAIESMWYLTTGLIDNYENQDCELESSIVKVFSSEQTLANTTTCLNLIGLEAALENHWCSQMHREAMCYVNFPDQNNHLKILIALFGLRHAGQNLNALVKQLRNPLYHASFVFKRLWTHRKQMEDNPKLTLHLEHYLHPSLLTSANSLEYCVLRLQYATEVLLSRHGPEVVNKHIELKRLSECLMDIYGMVACLGRASRSYCIGLQHADMELTLANTFVHGATERVRGRIRKIVDGPFMTNDRNHQKIARGAFKFKEYCPVHPLTRNF